MQSLACPLGWQIRCNADFAQMALALKFMGFLSAGGLSGWWAMQLRCVAALRGNPLRSTALSRTA